MFFCPFNAGGRQDRSETTLIDADRVANNCEVYEGDLVEILMEVALVRALTVNALSAIAR